MIEILGTVFSIAVKLLSLYTVVVAVLAAAIAVHQEQKIWSPRSLPSLSFFGGAKVFFYNIVWMFLCLVGSVLVVIKWLVTLGSSDIARDVHVYVERIVAKICVRTFLGNVSLRGTENLPLVIEGSVPAPIFVANHASQIDIGLPYFFGHRFKWISKHSVFYLPGVGIVMYLGKHIIIDRRTGKNQKSVSNLFLKSSAALQSGIPIFIFPQGTRRIDEELAFKQGAFVMAKTNKSSIIPVSIDIPRNAWNVYYPLNLLWGGKPPTMNVTIHKLITVTGDEDLEVLKAQCRDRIYSVLIKPEDAKEK